jgi:transcriptional regulator with XRE-family HTH domain
MATVPEVTVEVFLNEYEQIRTPDFARIGDYVNIAKGRDRSMAQFAESTGIGASTLSRIVNGRSTKPLSKEVIVKIYEARADQDYVHLLDYLARANGMFPKEFAERVKTRDHFAAKRNEEISREHMMKNALIAGAVSFGVPISQVISQPIYRTGIFKTYMPRKRGNFVLELAPIDNNVRERYSWTFFLYSHIHDELDDERHLSVKQIVYNIIERASGWFLMDAWGNDIVKGDKFSFCFVDEAIFQQFVDALQEAKLHTEMTAILMNPTNFTVEREVWLPGQYDRLTETSVFLTPAPTTSDEDDYYAYEPEDTEDNE